jgi:predicted kinase
MSRRTYAILRRKAARWLRRGQSVVLDASYGQPSERAALRQLARRAGARLYVIACRASEAVLRSRLSARLTDAHSTSDARPELWPALRSAFVEPADTAIAFEADTTRPPQALVDEILSDLYATEGHAAEARAA